MTLPCGAGCLLGLEFRRHESKRASSGQVAFITKETACAGGEGFLSYTMGARQGNKLWLP